MPDDSHDSLLRDAVAAMDAGDLGAVERMVAEHPRLLHERLEVPGAWLRDRVGGALDDFFRAPYLLWFVAEDPVRNGRLPANIAAIAAAIIAAARREGVANLEEQVNYALRLVSWSWIARDCGVQIGLIDVLVDAGAAMDGRSDDALVNRNRAAAEHMVARGARLTLATALCLDRWDDASALAASADARERQFALVLAALNGRAESVRRMLALGADVARPSENLYSHGIPIHHAVCSGSLETVAVFADAGSPLDVEDTAWHATPLGWAEYYRELHAGDERAERYQEIARYLRERGARAC